MRKLFTAVAVVVALVALFFVMLFAVGLDNMVMHTTPAVTPTATAVAFDNVCMARFGETTTAPKAGYMPDGSDGRDSLYTQVLDTTFVNINDAPAYGYLAGEGYVQAPDSVCQTRWGAGTQG